MKFAIITHAVHKNKGDDYFAYEPYVREMNLWLKYVDEVKIVAPFSKEPISTIESSYFFTNRRNRSITDDKKIVDKAKIPNQVGNDDSKRHSVLDTESYDMEHHNEMLHQVGNNDYKRHSVLDAESFNFKEDYPSNFDGIELIKIPSFDITTFKNSIKALTKIPKICYQIYKAMQWADHIHLRCPGNIGLLGCFVQMLFPHKPKTVKYAGNWDPNSKQPISYKLQQWIVQNTFLTRNCKVLVYGAWQHQTKNIVPFFTASYSEKEIAEVQIRNVSIGKEKIAMSRTPNDESVEEGRKLKQVQHEDSNRHSALDAESVTNKLKFIYVGGLTPGKQPLLSIQMVHELKRKGYNVQLDMYGDGVEKAKITDYILDNSLEGIIILHGNASKEEVKKAYQQAHFLVFLSKSEGWPKVVAEAMFWGCVPITSKVSCVPYMLDYENRGTLVNFEVNSIVNAIENYVNDVSLYERHAQNGMEWSRTYTLEKFEEEIKKLL